MGYRTRSASELKGEKIVDSRDLIQALEEMEGDRQMALEATEEAKKEGIKEGESWLADGADEFLVDEWDEEMEEEYRTFKEFCQDCERDVSGWSDGAVLIHEDYWVEYVQELAEDLGYIKRDVSWPYNHIDWDAAADELEQDYSKVEWDWDTYLVRD